jgi:hypothetical protein
MGKEKGRAEERIARSSLASTPEVGKSSLTDGGLGEHIKPPATRQPLLGGFIVKRRRCGVEKRSRSIRTQLASAGFCRAWSEETSVVFRPLIVEGADPRKKPAEWLSRSTIATDDGMSSAG